MPRYEPNPKHKQPWQRGRKGTLCPPWSHAIAHTLFDQSNQFANGRSRYATQDGIAFRALPSDHAGDLWHGFPIPWNEVPTTIVRRMLDAGLVTRRATVANWKSIDGLSDRG